MIPDLNEHIIATAVAARRAAQGARHSIGLLLVTVACLLAACATIPAPIVPPPLVAREGASAVTVVSADTRSAQTEIQNLPVPPQAGAPRARAAEPVVRPVDVPPSGETAALSLEQVSLGTFAQLVYADILKKNVNIDPQVLARKDLVTFRSGSTQSPAQLEHAARLLLKSYGVDAVDLGGLVRVVPDNASLGNLPEIRRGAALPETPLPLRPIFQLVELQAVRYTDVTGWLRTMFGDRVRAQEDANRNALLLSATPENMRAALEAIRVLDQPVLAGVQSASITPVYWSSDELARRLFDVLTAQGYAVQPFGQSPGSIRYPIILLPITGLNSVFVFARGADVLKHVTDWARNLDKPNERGIGKNYFTYSVKHKDASVLAATLDQLLSGSRTAAPAAAAAAGATGTPRASVVVDKATNMLIFQASPDEYSQLTSLLQTLDRPTKGALIEVTVAELSIDDKSQLGIEWLTNAAISRGGTVSVGTLGGLSIGSAGVNLRVFDSVNALRGVINALASENKATILSSPRLLARNGEQATIQVGQDVPIITSQQTTPNSTTTGTSQVLQTIQYRTTGVILRVKPVIHSSDQIDLDVTQEVSAAVSTNTGVNNSPTFSTRKVDTKLTLKNGATVLLGGLISNETSAGNAGIPLLKDIPLLGNLFKTQTTGGTRRELIVLITPYVINDDHDAETLTNAFRGMLGTWAGTATTPAAVPKTATGAETAKPPAAAPVLPASASPSAPASAPAGR